MNLFERLNQWLESQINPQTPTLRTSRKELNDRARVAAYVEQYDLALEIFQQAYAMAVQSEDLTAIADAKLNRADILIKQNHLAQAKDLLLGVRDDTKARKHYAPLAYALCSLGTIAQLENAWEEARAYYEEARDIASTHQMTGAEGRANGHLADVYLHDNNANFAIHLLRQAIPALEQSGDNELIAYFMATLGKALIASGQAKDGEKLLHNALFVASASRQIPIVRLINQWLGDYAYDNQQYKDAAIHYQEFLRHKSDYAPTQATMQAMIARIAYSQYKSHRLTKAFKHLPDLNQYITDNAGTDDAGTSKSEINLIGLLLNAQQASAMTEIDQIASHVAQFEAPLNAIQVDIIETLATQYQHHGQQEQARNLYQQIAQRSQDPVIQARMQSREGYILQAQNKPDEALQRWEQVIKVFDTHQEHTEIAQLYCDLGELYLAQGNGLRCQQNYNQALIHLNHINAIEVRGIILANAAIAYNRDGDIENAEPFFREALEIAERTQNTHATIMRRGNYGIFLAQVGDTTPAQIAITQALDNARQLQHPLAIAIQQHNLGYCHALSGDTDAAQSAYEEALIQLSDIDAGYWHTLCQVNLAMLWLKQGAITTAQSILARAKTYAHTRNVPLDIAIGLGEAHIALYQEDVAIASTITDEQLQAAKRCKMPRLIIYAQLLQAQIAQAQGKDDLVQAYERDAHTLMKRIKLPDTYLPF